MAKIHTTVKRKATARRVGRNRKSRPKTFRSEEAAKMYAEANGLKNYSLVNISRKLSRQKFRVVSE